MAYHSAFHPADVIKDRIKSVFYVILQFRRGTFAFSFSAMFGVISCVLLYIRHNWLHAVFSTGSYGCRDYAVYCLQQAVCLGKKDKYI